ncbi:MAG: ABC transporter permease subunit [Propionibacteriales bacterium]|nr:ABC transporter permease subunit [Propionibacteriales bacterium]
MTTPAVDTSGGAPSSGSTPLEEPANLTWWQRYGDTTIIWTGRLTLLLALVVLWELLSGPVLDPLFVSRPSDVAERLVGWVGDGTLWTHTWITVREIFGGYLLGAVTGMVAGFAVASQRNLARIIDPFMMALYSVPKVALAPLFIVWFGIGLQMKILLAAVMVFFLVFLNTVAGVRQVDRGIVDAARLMGASRRELLIKVTLPASFTGVITGLRVAIPYALIGAVIGELVASNRGLGYLISNSAATFDTAGVFAALVVLSVIAAVVNMLVDMLGRRTDRWKPLEREPS